MKLELHQLQMRYESTRVLDRVLQSRLTASLAEHGQQRAVLVVVDGAGARVLIDGYRRCVALKSLSRDEVEVAELPLEEPDALCHQLARSSARSTIEEAWLLRELLETHQQPLRQMAVKLDRSASWVSRRLALLRALPDLAEQGIREGRIVAHGAMRCLVPLARANAEHCELLVKAMWDDRLSVRELDRVYAGWRRADVETRREIVTNPRLFLRAEAAQEDPEPPTANPETTLIAALDAVSATSSRALRHLPAYRERPYSSKVRLSWQQTQAAILRLQQEFGETDDRRGNAQSRPDPAPQGVRPESHRASGQDIA